MTNATKESHGHARDAFGELALKIYIGLAAQVYGDVGIASERKRPDPKALAAFSFRLADAFEQAERETDRAKAAAAVQAKSKVNLDDIDMSGIFKNLTKG